MGNGYRDLIVWHRAVELTVSVYKITEEFPQSEIYGLTAQMRRSAVSIPSNIAEGSKRGSRKDFTHFLRIALGSGAELETQVEIAKRLVYAEPSAFAEVEGLLTECMKMLSGMLRSKD